MIKISGTLNSNWKIKLEFWLEPNNTSKAYGTLLNYENNIIVDVRKMSRYVYEKNIKIKKNNMLFYIVLCCLLKILCC